MNIDMNYIFWVGEDHNFGFIREFKVLFGVIAVVIGSFDANFAAPKKSGHPDSIEATCIGETHTKRSFWDPGCIYEVRRDYSVSLKQTRKHKKAENGTGKGLLRMSQNYKIMKGSGCTLIPPLREEFPVYYFILGQVDSDDFNIQISTDNREIMNTKLASLRTPQMILGNFSGLNRTMVDILYGDRGLDDQAISRVTEKTRYTFFMGRDVDVLESCNINYLW
jgi:hypothetical protein